MIPLFLFSHSNNTIYPPDPGLDPFPGIGLTNSPPPRWSGMMDYLPGVGTVLFGGKTTSSSLYNGLLADTWLWNGIWRQLNIAGPSARNDSVMSFDGANITLFGGSDTTKNLSDTWSFNGTSWSKLNVNGLKIPSKLADAKLSYQSGSSKSFMFGGRNAVSAYVKDTWSWAQPTNTWALLTPFTMPAPRAYQAQASSSTAMVIFGGKNSDSILSDTWFFDGTFWNIVTPANGVVPGARYGATMVYDSGNNLFVMFGGITANGYNSETWVFNLNTAIWKQITTPLQSTPLRRAFAQMAYDSGAGNTVLFGGLKDDTDLNDTWVFNSTTNTWTAQ